MHFSQTCPMLDIGLNFPCLAVFKMCFSARFIQELSHSLPGSGPNVLFAITGKWPPTWLAGFVSIRRATLKRGQGHCPCLTSGLNPYNPPYVARTPHGFLKVTEVGLDIFSPWTQLGWKAFKPHHWVAFIVFGWGVISALQFAVTSCAGLMVCHIGLGIVEAIYSSGTPLYLSYFSPREKVRSEDGYRHFPLCAGDCVRRGSGLRDAQAKWIIAPWRILFILEGVPTGLLAVLAWYAIPDPPTNAYSPKGRDRDIAIGLSLRQPGDRETTGLLLKQV